MLISTPRSPKIQKPLGSAPHKSGAPDPAPQENSRVKDLVTKSAYATGGAMGGVGLGVVTGQVLSNLTGTSLFAKIGGVAGGLAGAATALSASNAENTKEALTKSFLAWTGSSLGSAAGMVALGGLGQTLSEAGASSLFGSQGQLIGAATGAIAGAALPLITSEGATATNIKRSALSTVGASAGLYAGGLAQALLSELPGMGVAAAPVPLLMATLGGVNLLDRNVNHEAREDLYYGHRKVTYQSDSLARANHTALGATIGYGIGLAVGAFADSAAQGARFYTYAAPLTLGLAGGLLGYGSGNEGLEAKSGALDASALLGGTAAGILAGDALGHGLAHITGNELYRTLGPFAGGANAFAAVSKSIDFGFDNDYIAPGITGVVAGTSAGALMGAGLGSLTGQTVWGTALPILGGVAGLLTGVALTANAEPSSPA